MRVLVADDDRAGATLLAHSLARLNLDVEVAHDGEDAWRVIEQGRVTMAIVDWVMPGADGLELCRRIRRNEARANMHVILVTARGDAADVVAGLDAGADDYLVKPFNPDELRARVRVGLRMLTLQDRVAERMRELQEALSKVKQLSGLLPICSYCKRIRRDQDYWQQVEGYISQHTDARFSHAICPACFEAVAADIERVQT
jgi:sigma-B regulation protein RsbU (phosphoserine phosphatase)